MRAGRTISLLGEKIKSLQELRKIILRLKSQGKKIVFTNGCFDLLHYGHAKYLEEAKKKGDMLVVAVNSDASVRRIKGKQRPIIRESNRLKLVAALESVDYAVLFDENTPLKTIKLLHPDILAKGSDWKKEDIVGGNFVLGYGGKIITIKLIRGLSSTALINKIAEISKK